MCRIVCSLLLFIVFAAPLSKAESSVLSEKEWADLNEIANATFRGFNALYDPVTRLPVDIAFVNSGEVVHKTHISYLNKTSPTNIGLAFLHLILARDRGLLSHDEAFQHASDMFNSIERLEKYEGYLYNWYHLEEKENHIPPVTMNRFISSLDNGNMDLCLMATAEAFSGTDLESRIETSLKSRDYKYFANRTDVGKEKGYLNLGFDEEKNEFHAADYGIFITEARMVTMIAILKDKVSERSWSEQIRDIFTYTTTEGEDIRLVGSWGGSLYEMLFSAEILGGADKAPLAYRKNAEKTIRVHEDWAKRVTENGIWGISNGMVPESERYEMAGVPEIANHINTDVFVTPYSSFLSLRYSAKRSLQNLFAMRQLNPLVYDDAYGFVDSIDPVSGKISDRILALDKGMEVLAIGNLLNKQHGKPEISDYVWRYFKRKGWHETAFRLMKADESHPSFLSES